MAKIILNKKEFTCSQELKEEIQLLQNKLTANNILANRCSDVVDELQSEILKKVELINKNINEIINYKP